MCTILVSQISGKFWLILFFKIQDYAQMPPVMGGGKIEFPSPHFPAGRTRRPRGTDGLEWMSAHLYTLSRNRQDNVRDRRPRPPTTLKVGVLNVRGISTDSQEQKREEIGRLFRKRKLDVLALSETKMKGIGSSISEFGGVEVYWSGVDEAEHASSGVALLLSPEMKGSMTDHVEVSDRIMWIKLKLGREVWAIVSAYGPDSGKTDEVRANFWNELRDCVNSFGNNVKVMVLGDLNARVGNTVIDGVVGVYSVPGVNESGEKLIDMCLEQELVVGNTFFKKKRKNKYTWERQVRGIVVDYVLIAKKEQGRLVDVHAFPTEAGVISDHHLVEGKLIVAQRWRGRQRGQKREVIRVSELNKVEKAAEFLEKLKVEWERIKERECGGTEPEWKMFKEAVFNCAKEVCGMRKVGGKRKKGSEYWGEELKKASRDKRRAFEGWVINNNDRTRERYNEKKREMKRLYRREKRRKDASMGDNMTKNFAENKKLFWKEVKSVRQEEGQREEAVRDSNGQILIEEEAVNKRWAEYFEDLFKFGDDREAILTVAPFEQGVPRLEESNSASIKRREVVVALGEMRNGKAPGLDGITVECLKKGGEVVVEWLMRVLGVCFREGEVPADWRRSCIVPIYKGKGDKRECGNYRGISLLSVVGKLFGRILIKRIREGTEGALKEEQCGFRIGRGCVYQIFAVRQVSEKYLEKGKDVYWAFMDLEKAYDRIDRNAMWKMLSMYGVGGKLLTAVKSFYVDSRACVRVGCRESEWFPVKVGLRQGCVMSPWLFNIFMDGVVREVYARMGGRGLELINERGWPWMLNQLLFADDTALVASSEEELQQLVKVFDEVCKRRKLKVNIGKSKVMRCTRNIDDRRLDVRIGGEMLEEVDSFKYLGSVIARDGGIAEEVKSRVGEASKVIGGMNKLFKCREMGMRAKKGIFEAVGATTALYAAEGWNMRKEDGNRLDVMEMRCLRSMCGVTRWDRVRNEEVRRRTGVLRELSQRAEQKGLQWFGHMERMNDDRMTKKIMRSEVGGRRQRGKPKTRWKDSIKKSLGKRGLSMDQGHVKARNRSEWKGVVNADVVVNV